MSNHYHLLLRLDGDALAAKCLRAPVTRGIGNGAVFLAIATTDPYILGILSPAPHASPAAVKMESPARFFSYGFTRLYTVSTALLSCPSGLML
jgi:hypothetical protein